jgi:hypothetical protein
MATKNSPTGKSTKAEPKSTTAKAAPSKAAASKEKATPSKAANVNPAPKSTAKESKATESKATETQSKSTTSAVVTKEPVATKQENLPASVTEQKKGKIEKSTITAEHIAIRAYLLWQERGFNHGGDVSDWLRAEAELNSLN